MSFVDTVKNLSAAGRYDTLYQYCCKIAEDSSIIGNDYDLMLSNLEIQQHSLGVLAILFTKIKEQVDEDIETILSEVEEFISNCNGDQIRVASEIFVELCKDYCEILIAKKQLFRGILNLPTAITKLQSHPLQLTSLHSDLCQLCLMAKCPKPALQFLDIDFNEIAKENKSFDVKYFLQYYYYGGMIYASLKKFERALYFFESAITTPAMSISAIIVESYKKYILISLMLHGKIKNLPKYTSQVVTRNIKGLVPAYVELSFAYSTCNIHKINTVVNENKDQFKNDTNMGLVKQCVASLYKKNVLRLTKTFLTLSLENMAQRINLANKEEAEQFILNMIEEGEMFAQINQKDGMIVFQDNSEKFTSLATLKQIEDDMNQCIQLDEKVRLLDEENCKNPKYISKLRNED